MMRASFLKVFWGGTGAFEAGSSQPGLRNARQFRQTVHANTLLFEVLQD